MVLKMSFLVQCNDTSIFSSPPGRVLVGFLVGGGVDVGNWVRFLVVNSCKRTREACFVTGGG